MKMFSQLFDQIAFVTNDMDRATALLGDRYGVERFAVGEQTVVAEENGVARTLTLRVAQAMMDGGELEIIQDLGSDIGLFRRGLPGDGSFAVRSHHIQFQITGEEEEWHRYLADMRASATPPLLTGTIGDDLMHYAFVDAADDLGLALEYVWFSEAMLAKLRQVPRV